MSLCNSKEAQAFHPPEKKPSESAALWAVIVVIIALAGVGLWIVAGVLVWPH